MERFQSQGMINHLKEIKPLVKRLPRGFFMKKESRIIFTELLVDKLEKKIEDITSRDFVRNGLGRLIYHTSHSHYEALREAGHVVKPSKRREGVPPRLTEEEVQSRRGRNLTVLKRFGFTNSEIKRILKANTPKEKRTKYQLFLREGQIFSNNLKSLRKYGFNKREIKKIISVLPFILSFRKGVIKQKLDCFESFGFTRREIIRIIVKYPVLLGNSKEYINNSLYEIGKLGTNRENAKHTILRCPQILVNFEGKFRKVSRALSIYGFTINEVRRIVLYFPAICECSQERIRNTIYEFKRERWLFNPLSNEEVHRIFTRSPGLFSYKPGLNRTLDRQIRLRILIARKTGSEPFDDPMKLIRGRRALLQRIRFFRIRHHPLIEHNLYRSRGEFHRRFGVYL